MAKLAWRSNFFLGVGVVTFSVLAGKNLRTKKKDRKVVITRF